MKKIYKYTIQRPEINQWTSVALPQNIEILDCQLQTGNVVLWGIVDLEKRLVERNFYWVGTGWELPFPLDWEKFKYIKTIQFVNGLVFHLFMEK